MSAKDKPGVLQIIGAVVLIVVGVIINIFGGNGTPLIQYGLNLLGNGALAFAAGSLMKVKESGSLESDSPTYAFLGAENPTHGDTAVAVIYANDTASDKPGHMVSPTIMAAFTTPKGFEDSDFTRARSLDGQALSMLLAVGEGPIVGINDLRLNGEPVFEEHVGETIGAGNGTKKKWVLEGRGIDLRSIDVSVAGTQKSWLRIARTELAGIGDGVKYFFSVTLTDAGVEIDDQHDLKFYLGASANTSTLLAADADVRPIAWMDEGRTTLYINTQVPLPSGQKLWVGLIQRYLKDLTLKRAADEKSVAIEFTTAPTNGAAIVASWNRKVISGVRVEYRYGCAHQLPISGFDMIQNTINKNSEMTFNDSFTYATDEAVDDVRLTFASGSGGFTAIDIKDGGRSPVSAQIQIEWKLSTESDSAYRTLNDPAGATAGKRLNEFKLSADSTEVVIWEFAVRRLLAKWVAEHPGDTKAAGELKLWQRSKVTIRVKRTNKVQNNTNTYVSDVIVWASSTKVIEEKLSHPGLALIGISAVASSKLNGAMPRITCRARGLRDVEAYDGTSWVASETAQSNPVWAAVDLITNKRYGGGEQYTKAANIDATSARTAATWCDNELTRDGKTEKRAVIDYVADLRRQLMDQVRDMLLPAQVVPVQRGNVWYFVVDRDEVRTGAFVITDDGKDGRTLKDSMGFAHQPITSRITELQVGYLDRDDDWQRAEVWVAPQVPATDRRIQRATAFGVTRASQATAFAQFLYAKQTQQGAIVSWGMVPSGVPIEAGDVLRVVSSRLGIDMYVRIMRWTLESTDELSVTIEGAEYVPQVYGQDFASHTVIRRKAEAAKSLNISAPTGATNTGTGEGTGSAQLSASIRAAA